MSQLPKSPQPPEPGDRLPAERGRTQFLEMDCKVAALLCYMPVAFLNIVIAGFWLNMEPGSNRFLRFHAYQSILLSLGFIAVAAALWLMGKILGLIPFLALFGILGTAATYLLVISYMAINFYMAYHCLQGKILLLPYIGDIADQNSM